MSVVEIKSNFSWQWPALTEKYAFYIHQCDNSSSNKIYIGCPWASIIDFIKISAKTFDFMEDENIKKYLLENLEAKNFFGLETHTVCQHVSWERMLGFWKHIGIKNIHLSHLTHKQKKKKY